MATLYRGSPSRFAFAQSHYASSSGSTSVAASTNDPQSLQHLQQLRYNAYAVEGHNVPLPPPPRASGLGMGGLSAPMPPPGASIGLSAGKQLYGNVNKAPMYVQGLTGSPLYMNPLLPKAYPPQPSEMLFVSPGMPTPVELSIYEMKQPTGLLHVTIGNQTVEFLDGVANMPQKR